MAMAVRIARAYSQKDLVLFCGYHGWHDWYLSANLASDKALDGHLLPGLDPLGVPRALKGTALPFKYNDTGGFLKLFNLHKSKIAAVVMEPVRGHYPQKDFLAAIKKATATGNIPLIVDEITAGFRLNCGGAHLLLGIEPDIAVFAKGMSNGYPMAAVIGKRKVMETAQQTFISSTYWTERIGPTAALATIKKIRKLNVTDHLCKIGKSVQDGWEAMAKKNGLHIDISGIFPLGHFSFKYGNPLELKTLFTQLMLQKGFLATNAFYASYAHKPKVIDSYLQAVDPVFKIIARAQEKGQAAKYLKSPVCHSGFQRLT